MPPSVPHRAGPAGVRPGLDSPLAAGQCRAVPQPETAGPEPQSGHHLEPQPAALLHLPGLPDHPRRLQAGRRGRQEEGEQGAGGPHQVQEQEVHAGGPALRAPRSCRAEAGPEAAVSFVIFGIFDPDVIVTAHRDCAVFCLILIYYVL